LTSLARFGNGFAQSALRAKDARGAPILLENRGPAPMDVASVATVRG